MLGKIRQLWRYPVKSLRGETLQLAAVDKRGLIGDRLYALVNDQGKIASGKNTRRFFQLDGLFDLASRREGDATFIEFPDGRCIQCDDSGADDVVSDYFRTALQVKPEQTVSHLDDSPIHLVTTADLERLESRHGRPVDARRFRPNLIVDFDDDHAIQLREGVYMTLGSAMLRIRSTTERCRMVTLAQDGLPGDKPLLKSIALNKAVDFGYYADVIQPGTFAVDDTVFVQEASPV